MDKIWNVAEEYADKTDLTMAKEMKAAIAYKKTNPWMLSYPMSNFNTFTSHEFNRFEPYFTITEDGVMYNIFNISLSELIFENHLQALSSQICGHISKYSQDSRKLMCGYTYMGLKTCPHYINDECDGHIDSESVLPDIVLDKDMNIKNGCTFEMLLNINDICIRDINIGYMRKLTYDEIMSEVKKHTTQDTPN